MYNSFCERHDRESATQGDRERDRHTHADVHTRTHTHTRRCAHTHTHPHTHVLRPMITSKDIVIPSEADSEVLDTAEADGEEEIDPECLSLLTNDKRLVLLQR